MSCSDKIPPHKTKCGYIRPMDLETRRQLLERQSWIDNVVRIKGMSKEDAEHLWLRLKLNNESKKV